MREKLPAAWLSCANVAGVSCAINQGCLLLSLGTDFHKATVDAILQFLQSQLESGKAAGTLRGTVAVIKAVTQHSATPL